MPPAILRRVDEYLGAGKSYAYIADMMNMHRIVDGMGGRGWSPKKVRAKYETYLEQMAADVGQTKADLAAV